MLSDGFDLHRCLSLEKDGGEISDFSHHLRKNGEMNDARWPGYPVFFLQFNPRFLKDYANHSVLRIDWYSSEN
jgi:hypothetical protein